MIKKSKLAIKKEELKIKILDRKIDILKQKVYKNASSFKTQKQNIKVPERIEKRDDMLTDSSRCSNIHSLFKSLQCKECHDKYFNEIIDVLRNEIYRRPSLEMDENALLKSMTVSEKSLYSLWILQTILNKLSKKNNNKYLFDTSFEFLSYMQGKMECCSLSVSEGFQTTLRILDKISNKALSDNEQDFLIFIFLKAQMQNIFEESETIEVHCDDSQPLPLEMKSLITGENYLQLLTKWRHLVDYMEKTDLLDIFHAIAKPENIQRTMDTFESFREFISCISGEWREIQQKGQREGSTHAINVTYDSCEKLDFEVEQSVDPSAFIFLNDFSFGALYEAFKEEVRNLHCDVEIFLKNFVSMSINDINKCRKLLKDLKVKMKVILQSKWKCQKFQPGIFDDGAEYNENDDPNRGSVYRRSLLLFENLQDTMFYLKILDKMELNPHFTLMSSLCELRNRKDLLIQKFRNFVLRIGHQKMAHIPLIKKDLFEIDKEIQVLSSDYKKLRLKLQFLKPQEERNMYHLFEDIEAIVLGDVKMHKEKKFVGQLPIKKLNIIESETVQKKTKDSLDEIQKMVDETKEFLHSLDKTLISKEFCAMRCLCELHEAKEQILMSFEILLNSMFKLSLEEEVQIIKRLEVMRQGADVITKNYENIGMQLMLFLDVMAMVNREKHGEEFEDHPIEEESLNVSGIFGPSDEMKKLHCSLDPVARNKWFPAKAHLFDLMKEKMRIIQAFKNFLEKLAKLDCKNMLDDLHAAQQLIISTENILRKYQCLRMQLIWIAGDKVFRIKKN